MNKTAPKTWTTEEHPERSKSEMRRATSTRKTHPTPSNQSQRKTPHPTRPESNAATLTQIHPPTKMMTMMMGTRQNCKTSKLPKSNPTRRLPRSLITHSTLWKKVRGRKNSKVPAKTTKLKASMISTQTWNQARTFQQSKRLKRKLPSISSHRQI